MARLRINEDEIHDFIKYLREDYDKGSTNFTITLSMSREDAECTLKSYISNTPYELVWNVKWTHNK